MHLQMDQKFQQNEIKTLNSKFNLQMFGTRISGGEAFVVKQANKRIQKTVV